MAGFWDDPWMDPGFPILPAGARQAVWSFLGLPGLTFSHLKMDGWNIYFSLLLGQAQPVFDGAFAFSFMEI